MTVKNKEVKEAKLNKRFKKDTIDNSGQFVTLAYLIQETGRKINVLNHFGLKHSVNSFIKKTKLVNSFIKKSNL